MTYEERNAIVDPAPGLMIYCTNCVGDSLQRFNGLDWVSQKTPAFNFWERIGPNINGSSSEDFGSAVSLSADGYVIAIGASTSNDGGTTMKLIISETIPRQ